MNQPSISVIIPAYQHAHTIARCLESLFVQTLPPQEIIVVNDGSTDHLLQVLQPYLEKILLINQENQGSNQTRNNGFTASHGDRVIFCDADVIMYSDMLEKLSKTLDTHPNAGYAYSGFRFGWKRFRSFPFHESLLTKMNYIHTTALIRREAFSGFDVSIRRLQDWDLWLTLLKNGWKGIFVNEELFHVLVESKSHLGTEWRPSLFYRIPWRILGWKPLSMKKYEEARTIIRQKHGLIS